MTNNFIQETLDTLVEIVAVDSRFLLSSLKLAYCGGPPYYYKVAYEEAERMLESVNKM